MQYTTHYNLNLPEGTDIVNPLVQDNPNYSAIDTALYNNKVRVVGNATEVKSGTVHAITRSDSDIDVIRFTATGDWITGDTMTVDGSPVSVYLPDGTAPLTGAFIINTEVLCVINGTRVTLLVGGASSIDAINVVYDNTSSGLSATDAQNAIDELSDAQNIKYDNSGSGLAATNVKGAIDELAAGTGSVSVVGDGVKTYAQLFAELYAICDPSKIKPGSNINLNNGSICYLMAAVSGAYYFGCQYVYGTVRSNGVVIGAVNYTAGAVGTTVTDNTNAVYPAGAFIKLTY